MTENVMQSEAPSVDRTPSAARALRLRRQHLRRAMEHALTGILSAEEIDVHFSYMPDRYWSRANEETVQRHLLVVHRFLGRLTAPDSDGTTPFMAWRQLPDRDVTEVEICSWDRLGLLANVAGASAAAELSIVRADVYTRVDNVVLDVFQVCDADGHRVHDEAKLHLMDALLTAALRPDASPAPLRDWEADDSSPVKRASPQVGFDTERDDAYTALILEADDRIGLLRDVLAALTDCRVNVTHAIITTDGGRAGDVLYLTDADGSKIASPARLEHIRDSLLRALD